MKINGHFIISMIKSVLRIAGCIFGIVFGIKFLAILFLIAEVLGIFEEVVDNR